MSSCTDTTQMSNPYVSQPTTSPNLKMRLQSHHPLPQTTAASVQPLVKPSVTSEQSGGHPNLPANACAHPSSNSSGCTSGCATDAAILGRFLLIRSACHALTAFEAWLEELAVSTITNGRIRQVISQLTSVQTCGRTEQPLVCVGSSLADPHTHSHRRAGSASQTPGYSALCPLQHILVSVTPR